MSGVERLLRDAANRCIAGGPVGAAWWALVDSDIRVGEKSFWAAAQHAAEAYPGPLPEGEPTWRPSQQAAMAGRVYDAPGLMLKLSAEDGRAALLEAADRCAAGTTRELLFGWSNW